MQSSCLLHVCCYNESFFVVFLYWCLDCPRMTVHKILLHVKTKRENICLLRLQSAIKIHDGQFSIQAPELHCAYEQWSCLRCSYIKRHKPKYAKTNVACVTWQCVLYLGYSSMLSWHEKCSTFIHLPFCNISQMFICLCSSAAADMPAAPLWTANQVLWCFPLENVRNYRYLIPSTVYLLQIINLSFVWHFHKCLNV